MCQSLGCSNLVSKRSAQRISRIFRDGSHRGRKGSMNVGLSVGVCANLPAHDRVSSNLHRRREEDLTSSRPEASENPRFPRGRRIDLNRMRASGLRSGTRIPTSESFIGDDEQGVSGGRRPRGNPERLHPPRSGLETRLPSSKVPSMNGARCPANSNRRSEQPASRTLDRKTRTTRERQAAVSRETANLSRPALESRRQQLEPRPDLRR